uniref:NADH-ubiquinone oxidoreductase chain 3 n=1 Tax=Agonoscena pistaciae TaxID=1635299 RepID=A0A8F2PVY9_9HEMI|nr:NADH dehydrogenase subunit 3 [Agonoscena pistaciae]
MLNLMVFFVTLLFLLTMVINLIPLIAIHKKKDRESLSPFECGFDPLSSSRLSFSIHFFIICLMFLIFDIEIVMILPAPLTANLIFTKKWMYTSLLIFMMLIMSIWIEWKEGSMNWK